MLIINIDQRLLIGSIEVVPVSKFRYKEVKVDPRYADYFIIDLKAFNTLRFKNKLEVINFLKSDEIIRFLLNNLKEGAKYEY